MAKNESLHRAKRAKSDEFYTQLVDIERELKHYKHHFRGKTVFCNCDDPYESNFFRYFAMNFNYLGLKKLICTCYGGSPIVGEQLEIPGFRETLPNEQVQRRGYKIEITEVTDTNGDGVVDLTDVVYLLRNGKNTLTMLEGDGDFRSPECVAILREADIVVTNPPFSLFREYLAQLMEFGKQFLIIGNQNAITYKEVFPLLQSNQMWLGYRNGDMAFMVPSYYEERSTRYWVDEAGQKWRSMGNICWFTNLDIPKRHENLSLYRAYDPMQYPHYDNYDAINVDKVSEIPEDYYGVMGVPITFLDKYNPDQFELLDANNFIIGNRAPYKSHGLIKDKDGAINGKPKYARILIRRRRDGN